MARSKGAGSVEVYKDGYRLRWTEKGGTRRSKIVRPATKRQAEQLLRETVSGLHAQESRPNGVRFSDLAHEYLAAREPLVAHGTYRNWVSLLNTTLLPAFGTLTLDQITQRREDLWWARAGWKPVLRRNAYFTLRSMMKLAVRWGYLPAWTVEVEGAERTLRNPGPRLRSSTWTVCSRIRTPSTVLPSKSSCRATCAWVSLSRSTPGTTTAGRASSRSPSRRRRMASPLTFFGRE